MSELDFYIEGIQQLPAIVEKGPAAQEQVARTFSEFVDLAHLYESAIEVVKTYLGILDSEFSIKFQRNPIHDIKSRMKSAESIIGKLQKKGIPLTPEKVSVLRATISAISTSLRRCFRTATISQS